MAHPASLSPTLLRNLKAPAAGRVDYPDGDTPGLCLRVSADATKRWTLRMRDAAGGLRRFVLGEYNKDQGLAWARREADKLRQAVRHNGADPHRERKARAKAEEAKAAADKLTLGVLVTDWQRIKLADRSARYRAEAVRAIHFAFSAAWGRPAAALDRAAVRRAMDALRTKHPAMAARTVAYGRAAYAWAMKREVVTSDPFEAQDVPAVAARDRTLADEELGAVWKAAMAVGQPFGLLVRLLVLTGQRREEVTGMRWTELSDDLATWTLPRHRTKNNVDQIVPLSASAREIISKFGGPQGNDGLVFPGKRGTTVFSGWSKSKVELDEKIAEVLGSPIQPWRIHDLRRTLATGLQRLGVRLEVTEAVLNHVSGSRGGIVGVYQRHTWVDEKRAALDEWEAHVLKITKEAEDAYPICELQNAS